MKINGWALRREALLAGHVLMDRERMVVRERLAGSTLAGLGRKMGVTTERVRQIEAMAVRRLRESVKHMSALGRGYKQEWDYGGRRDFVELFGRQGLERGMREDWDGSKAGDTLYTAVQAAYQSALGQWRTEGSLRGGLRELFGSEHYRQIGA